jgi:hypothetical protein
MLYLIGGPGRSGKTTLAWQLARRHGIPFFSLDYLMMGLHHGAPALQVNPNDPEAEAASRMWPVCKAMLVAMLENGEEYCVEGFALTPEHVSQLSALFPAGIRACFLGYCTADAAAKLADEARHPTTNAWPPERPREEALAEIESFKVASLALRAECARRGYAFFDTSSAFADVIAGAEHYLTLP